MSSAAAPVFSQEVAAYLRVWADCLAEVLGQVTGAPVACAPLTSPPEGGAPAEPADLWIRATYSGARSGELMARLPAAGVANLARVFMGDCAASSAQEQREAVLELLRQVAGLVATRARDPRGETALRLEVAEAPPAAPPATAWLRGSLAEPVFLEFQLSPALLDSLVPPAAPAPPPAEPPLAAGDKFERLMGVELTVSLRFGGRRMLLKDILELCAGAVVELDRQVHDPVDLLLDGKLVARGDVVVVDGNYGLRVTEVLSPVGAH